MLRGSTHDKKSAWHTREDGTSRGRIRKWRSMRLFSRGPPNPPAPACAAYGVCGTIQEECCHEPATFTNEQLGTSLNKGRPLELCQWLDGQSFVPPALADSLENVEWSLTERHPDSWSAIQASFRFCGSGSPVTVELRYARSMENAQNVSNLLTSCGSITKSRLSDSTRTA